MLSYATIYWLFQLKQEITTKSVDVITSLKSNSPHQMEPLTGAKLRNLSGESLSPAVSNIYCVGRHKFASLLDKFIWE